MFHLIKKEYWYKDEYILKKTLGWLQSCISAIMEDRYNQNLQLAWLVQLHIAQVLWAKDVKIPEWKNMTQWPEELKDEDLSDWGLWIW